MPLMLAICRPQPNWIPKKPKLISRTWRKERRGLFISGASMRHPASRESSTGRRARRSVDAAGGEGLGRPLPAQEEELEERHRVGDLDGPVPVHVLRRLAGGADALQEEGEEDEHGVGQA